MLLLDEYIADNYKDEIVIEKLVKAINAPDKRYLPKNNHNKPYKPQIKTKHLVEKFKKLYDKGHTDSEIATLAETNVANVYYWREANNLISNAKKKRDKKYAKVKALYEQGLKDKEISQKLNIPKDTICKWRNRNNLPTN